MSEPTRAILLEWFETLDHATLQEAWNFVLARKRGSEKRDRARRIEIELTGFYKAHPQPSEDDWKAFANYLKDLKLYKKTTVNCDIIMRMQRGTYGPRGNATAGTPADSSALHGRNDLE